MKLVVRDQQGQLSLTCPTCRQATPIPANGVAGLQSAFRVNHLLEILEEAKDTAASQEGAKSVMTHPIPPKKVIANCFEHTDTEDLICFKCAIKGGKHHDHDHHLLNEAFERYKGEVVPSLESIEGKLVAVKEALTHWISTVGRYPTSEWPSKSTYMTPLDNSVKSLTSGRQSSSVSYTKSCKGN